MMIEVNFYHLSVSLIEKSLPKLLEKIVSSGNRAVLYLENEQQVLKYNELLWTYSSRTFLAHGSEDDPAPARQPIFLTTKEINPNNASYIVVTEAYYPKHLQSFEKCLYLFDGSDEKQLALARSHYQKCKKDNLTLTYWQQDEKGAWLKN